MWVDVCLGISMAAKAASSAALRKNVRMSVCRSPLAVWEKQQAGVEQLGILLSDSRSKSSILHRQNGRKKIGRLPNADTRRRAEGSGIIFNAWDAIAVG